MLPHNVERGLPFYTRATADRIVPAILSLLFLTGALAATGRCASKPASHPSKPKSAAAKASTVPVVRAPSVAPNFSLTDADGKPHTLKELLGQPLVLYFYCGCPWCEHSARIWGQMQRNGALPVGADKETPMTLVIFTADSTYSKVFEKENGMDPKRTLFLPDTDMKVTNIYNADPCPRVFVLDAKGTVLYTNNHKDDAPRKAPEIVIASRAIGALRNAVLAAAPLPPIKSTQIPMPPDKGAAIKAVP